MVDVDDIPSMEDMESGANLRALVLLSQPLLAEVPMSQSEVAILARSGDIVRRGRSVDVSNAVW